MMRAGTETGSLVNHIYSRALSPVPAVGDGATILSWTDRQPATVVEVLTVGKAQIVATREDGWKRTDSNGLSEIQTYEYTPDPNGYLQHWKLKASGWVNVRKNPSTGRWVETKNGGVFFGRREKYEDPSF